MVPLWLKASLVLSMRQSAHHFFLSAKNYSKNFYMFTGVGKIRQWLCSTKRCRRANNRAPMTTKEPSFRLAVVAGMSWARPTYKSIPEENARKKVWTDSKVSECWVVMPKIAGIIAPMRNERPVMRAAFFALEMEPLLTNISVGAMIPSGMT